MEADSLQSAAIGLDDLESKRMVARSSCSSNAVPDAAAGVSVRLADSVAGARCHESSNWPRSHDQCPSNLSGRAERTAGARDPPSRLADRAVRRADLKVGPYDTISKPKGWGPTGQDVGAVLQRRASGSLRRWSTQVSRTWKCRPLKPTGLGRTPIAGIPIDEVPDAAAGIPVSLADSVAGARCHES